MWVAYLKLPIQILIADPTVVFKCKTKSLYFVEFSIIDFGFLVKAAGFK